MLFVFYCVTVLASSQDNTAEDETVDNKDERLPGTISKSDCLIPLIRVDFSTHWIGVAPGVFRTVLHRVPCNSILSTLLDEFSPRGKSYPMSIIDRSPLFSALYVTNSLMGSFLGIHEIVGC